MAMGAIASALCKSQHERRDEAFAARQFMTHAHLSCNKRPSQRPLAPSAETYAKAGRELGSCYRLVDYSP